MDVIGDQALQELAGFRSCHSNVRSAGQQFRHQAGSVDRSRRKQFCWTEKRPQIPASYEKHFAVKIQQVSDIIIKIKNISENYHWFRVYFWKHNSIHSRKTLVTMNKNLSARSVGKPNFSTLLQVVKHQFAQIVHCQLYLELIYFTRPTRTSISQMSNRTNTYNVESQLKTCHWTCNESLDIRPTVVWPIDNCQIVVASLSLLVQDYLEAKICQQL